MDNSQSATSGDRVMPIYLLTIRGTLASPALETSRDVHNSTAGAPANIAAAQQLGDLSHMVYTPVPGTGPAEGEFLIMDVWNSLDGLNRFFENPHVQEQAGQIFTERDPVVWTPAAGFSSFHLPPPYGRNSRYVAMVRGVLGSQDSARVTHNNIIASLVNRTRRASALSHEAYLRLSPPGSPAALEFLAVDVWSDLAGMSEIYNDPAFGSALQELFAAAPITSVWAHPAGEWVEW